MLLMYVFIISLPLLSFIFQVVYNIVINDSKASGKIKFKEKKVSIFSFVILILFIFYFAVTKQMDSPLEELNYLPVIPIIILSSMLFLRNSYFYAKYIIYVITDNEKFCFGWEKELKKEMKEKEKQELIKKERKEVLRSLNTKFNINTAEMVSNIFEIHQNTKLLDSEELYLMTVRLPNDLNTISKMNNKEEVLEAFSIIERKIKEILVNIHNRKQENDYIVKSKIKEIYK